MRLPQERAVAGLGTRRRVHSPSCATRTTVVSVTVVLGSRKASTPRRVWAKCSRCRKSELTRSGEGPDEGRRRNQATPNLLDDIHRTARVVENGNREHLCHIQPTGFCGTGHCFLRDL